MIIYRIDPSERHHIPLPTPGCGRALCSALASREYQRHFCSACWSPSACRYSCAATGSWLQENMLNFLMGTLVPFGQFWSSLCLPAIKKSFPHLHCRTPLYCPVLIQITACICSKDIKRLLRIFLNKLNTLLTTLKIFDFISQLL